MNVAPNLPNLTDDEKVILQYIKSHPDTGGRGVREHLLARAPAGSLSQTTFERRIDRLILLGLIRRTGTRRGAKYSAVGPLDRLSEPAQFRKPVSYNFDWLEAFKPNEDAFFTADDQRALMGAGQLPRGMQPSLFLHRVLDRFLVDLAFSSSRLEGNTYSLLETEQLLSIGREADNKKIEEARMLLNHKRAVLYILEHSADIEICPREIKSVHALLSDGLLEHGQQPGTLRTNTVMISETSYLPLATPQVIAEQFELITTKAKQIRDSFEQSLFLLAAIPYLQPFPDVNKRTGRLMANVPVMKAALCPLSYRDLNGKAYIDGMILFYETNNIAPLKDAFLQGYVASAERLKVYATESRRTVLAIEVIYDKAIKMAVREAVRRAQDGQSVESTVDRVLRSAPDNNRALLKTHINEILLALHPDGAIVYDLMPDEVETFRNMRPMPS